MADIALLDWERARPEAMRIRQEVFVGEQGVPADLEIDEADPGCLHALAFVDGAAVGTGRLLPDGHIGRMAVRRAWRGKGIGGALLEALVRAAAERGHREARLSAQVHALGFYRAHGFEAEGEAYEEAGIAHRAMRRAL